MHSVFALLRKIIIKALEKIAIKLGAKAGGKAVAKKIPVVGFFMGCYFGVQRMADGEWEKGGLEILSGAASTIPGPGTAASVAIDGGLLVDDIRLLKESYDEIKELIKSI